MQFSLRQLLLVVSAIGIAFGFRVLYGVAPTIGVIVLIALATYCVVRAKKRWPTLSPLLKTYAVSTAVGSTGLLVFAIAGITTYPPFARERMVKHVQYALGQDRRFSNIRVEYFEYKLSFVRVDGSVPTENDFHELRRDIKDRDWREMDSIRWRVTVVESQTTYEGWDGDLFGDEN